MGVPARIKESKQYLFVKSKHTISITYIIAKKMTEPLRNL